MYCVYIYICAYIYIYIYTYSKAVNNNQQQSNITNQTGASGQHGRDEQLRMPPSDRSRKRRTTEMDGANILARSDNSSNNNSSKHIFNF